MVLVWSFCFQVTIEGNVVTGAGRDQYYGPPNGRTWPMSSLPKGLNILVLPYYADSVVYYRLSTDPALINRAEQFIANWTGLEQGASFTPTNLLVVTWPNSWFDSWDAAVRVTF